MAEQIVAGRPLQIDSCRLTTKGMYINTGSLFWKKETLVPFSDLRLSAYSGQMNVSSAKDNKIKASMILRDIWNAILLEYIVKAVVQLKAER